MIQDIISKVRGFAGQIAQDKQKLTMIGGAAAVVLAVVIIMIIAGSGGKPPAANQNVPGLAVQKQAVNPTKAEVPPGTKVIGLNEQVSDKSIAVPVSVIEAAAGVTSKIRVFNVEMKDGIYTPSTIIANVGDIVRVNFTAVDKAYDVTFPDNGMKKEFKKGGSGVFEYQAVAPGKFTYYCESCGGLNSKTKGYFILIGK